MIVGSLCALTRCYAAFLLRPAQNLVAIVLSKMVSIYPLQADDAVSAHETHQSHFSTGKGEIGAFKVNTRLSWYPKALDASQGMIQLFSRFLIAPLNGYSSFWHTSMLGITPLHTVSGHRAKFSLLRLLS